MVEEELYLVEEEGGKEGEEEAETASCQREVAGAAGSRPEKNLLTVFD